MKKVIKFSCFNKMEVGESMGFIRSTDELMSRCVCFFMCVCRKGSERIKPLVIDLFDHQ